MKIIKYISGVVNKRSVNNNHSIKFNKKSYFLIDKNNEKKFFKKNTEILVIKAFDKNIYSSVDD